jgi:L-gulonate 5-dehydrogenase
MKASIFEAPGQMQVGEWKDPEPGPDDVLVRVKATGICAGDLYIYQGRNPYAVYPIIGGHEICGKIAAVGASVRNFQEGALVVVEPFLGCGQCYPCRVGKSNCCANLKIIGIHQPGGFAEFVAVPATHIHPVPKGLSPQVASFAEPVAIGIQACRRGGVKAGEIVLILGCGPIGLALIEVARALGAQPIATDPDDARLDFAKTLGADVLQADDQLLARVLERTHGEGAPVVIEATGNIRAIESTVHLVAAGGRIVIVGLVKKGLDAAFPGLDFTRKEMTLVGSRASVNCFPEALDLLAGGRVHYPRVATEIGMWRAPEVFAKLRENPAAMHKAVLVID